MTAGLDPFIVATFGYPPEDINLTATTTARNNAVVIALAVVSVLSVVGRVWAGRIKATPMWIDDWLIFVALVNLSTLYRLPNY